MTISHGSEEVHDVGTIEGLTDSNQGCENAVTGTAHRSLEYARDDSTHILNSQASIGSFRSFQTFRTNLTLDFPPARTSTGSESVEVEWQRQDAPSRPTITKESGRDHESPLQRLKQVSFATWLLTPIANLLPGVSLLETPIVGRHNS